MLPQPVGEDRRGLLPFAGVDVGRARNLHSHEETSNGLPGSPPTASTVVSSDDRHGVTARVRIGEEHAGARGRVDLLAVDREARVAASTT